MHRGLSSAISDRKFRIPIFSAGTLNRKTGFHPSYFILPTSGEECRSLDIAYAIMLAFVVGFSRASEEEFKQSGRTS
jgi:hypothetical protein